MTKEELREWVEKQGWGRPLLKENQTQKPSQDGLEKYKRLTGKEYKK